MRYTLPLAPIARLGNAGVQAPVTLGGSGKPPKHFAFYRYRPHGQRGGTGGPALVRFQFQN